MITERDAAMILEQNGFHVPNAGLDGFGEITYNGERVGTLYNDEIYIASEFPHLRNQTYQHTKKQGAIKLSSRCARSDLEYCIQVLFKSPAAFEQEIRAKRVYNVQRYFEKKKAQYIKTLADLLADELNAVGTAFMELNDEQKEMKESTCN